ncbi:MAG: hypothetical protein K1W17_02270, partial [Oscillospiraceae bacterium]
FFHPTLFYHILRKKATLWGDFFDRLRYIFTEYIPTSKSAKNLLSDIENILNICYYRVIIFNEVT